MTKVQSTAQSLRAKALAAREPIAEAQFYIDKTILPAAESAAERGEGSVKVTTSELGASPEAIVEIVKILSAAPHHLKVTEWSEYSTRSDGLSIEWADPKPGAWDGIPE